MRAALGSISTPYKRTRRNQNDALIGGRVIGQTAINNETLLTLLIFCRSLNERQIAESLVDAELWPLSCRGHQKDNRNQFAIRTHSLLTPSASYLSP